MIYKNTTDLKDSIKNQIDIHKATCSKRPDLLNKLKCIERLLDVELEIFAANLLLRSQSANEDYRHALIDLQKKLNSALEPIRANSIASKRLRSEPELSANKQQKLNKSENLKSNVETETVNSFLCYETIGKVSLKQTLFFTVQRGSNNPSNLNVPQNVMLNNIPGYHNHNGIQFPVTDALRIV
ncbi:MAG: hypothetical protein K2Q14_05020 [Gammaproteobacteria bacterium]|nr:hypothetical protein [Gammaproteobacteria bacterium]